MTIYIFFSILVSTMGFLRAVATFHFKQLKFRLTTTLLIYKTKQAPSNIIDVQFQNYSITNFNFKLFTLIIKISLFY